MQKNLLRSGVSQEHASRFTKTEIGRSRKGRSSYLLSPLLGLFDFSPTQPILIKLSSSFTLKLISAFNALNTFNIVSMVALLALLSSLEIWAF